MFETQTPTQRLQLPHYAVQLSLSTGMNVQVLAQLPSTNEALLVQAADLPSDTHALCALIACSQSAGRGRRGRAWEAAAGSAFLGSLGVQTQLGLPQLARLPLYIGVSVIEYLRSVGIEASLKWPNDVQVNGAKLAGILVETRSLSAQSTAVVMGVGVNWSQAPLVEGRDTTCAYACSTQAEQLDALNATQGLLDAVQRAWRRCLAQEALDFAPYDALFGLPVTALREGEPILGIAQGINAQGHLAIDTAQGRVWVNSGEVSVRELTVGLLDVGNSWVKLGQLSPCGSSEANHALAKPLAQWPTHSEDAVWQTEVAPLRSAQKVYAVGVAHEVAKAQVAKALPGVTVQWLTGMDALPRFKNAYGTPATLGADRYLAAYGAALAQTVPGDLVLATFGTATTVDLVCWDAAQACYTFEGGLILMGLELMLQGLSAGTARLPDVRGELKSVILEAPLIGQAMGKTTAQALLLGACTGQVASVIAVAKQHPTAKVYLAGGHASTLAAMMALHLPDAQTIDHAVLQGLGRYAQQMGAQA